MPWLAEDLLPFAGNPVLGARTRPKTFERCLWVSHYAVVLKPTDRLLDWFCARIPDPPRNPRGGRRRTDRRKRKALAGGFRLLDNGAKWKDLPRQFGSKSAMHWCGQWLDGEGVFERL